MCVIFVRFRCAFVIRKKEKKGVQKKKKMTILQEEKRNQSFQR